MSRSRRLYTTPGSFDFPPASSRDNADSSNYLDSQPANSSEDRSRGASVAQTEGEPNESGNTNVSELPSADITENAEDPNQTARPTSPETRLRMQRVLRQVHEMQNNADAIRDIQRVLDAQQENQTMMRDIHRRVHELRATQNQRSTERTNAERDGISEHSTRTHRPTGVTLPPISSDDSFYPSRSDAANEATFFPRTSSNSGQSPHEQNHEARAQTPTANFGVSIRRALHDASERLRQVNYELRRLLDRPIDGTSSELQRLSDAHDHLQEYLDRTLSESPDELQDLLQLDQGHDSSIVREGLNEARSNESHENHRQPNGSSPSVDPAESDLQRIFDDAMADVRSRHGTDRWTPRSVSMQNTTQPSASSNLASEVNAFYRDREYSGLPPVEFSTSPHPLGDSNSPVPDFQHETWRVARDRRRIMDSSFFPVSSQRSTQSDGDGEHSRHKRRRLNDEHSSGNLPAIKYGYEGQVVSGRLKLQLFSSDATILEAPNVFLHNNRYGAENVLKDDASVYYTKSQRCNMILQHQHQTAFCLERLVIKAPKISYHDPVQEGLIFVSMRNDEIFVRTARYQIYDFRTSQFAAYVPSTVDTANALGADSRGAVQRPRLASPTERHHHAAQENSLQPTSSTPRLNRQDELSAGGSDDASDDSTNNAPPPIRAQDFEDVGGRGFRIQRYRPPRTRAQNMLAQRVFDNVMARGAAARQRRHRRQLRASSSQTLANLSNSSDPTLEILAPAARFRMHPSRRLNDHVDDEYGTNTSDEDSDIMTVTFDPPLSGKFILLKMWSPRRGGNIDVQSVMAYGFAGPRWFPSEEMR